MLTESNKKAILSVINEEKKEIKLDLCIPNDIEEFLKELGYKRGEIETNGWQYDYWISYKEENKSFTFAGSGYYGEQSFSNDIEDRIVYLKDIKKTYTFECPNPECTKLIFVELNMNDDIAEVYTCDHCNEKFIVD